MISVILFIHVVICVLLIIIVLIQQGKGANAGAAFGGGSMFGSKGPASFMFKVTCFLCAVFFVTSILLGYLTSRSVKKQSQLTSTPVVTTPVSKEKVQTKKPSDLPPVSISKEVSNKSKDVTSNANTIAPPKSVKIAK